MEFSLRERVEEHCTASCEGRTDVTGKNFTREFMTQPNIDSYFAIYNGVRPIAYEILEEKKEGDNWTFKIKYMGEKQYFIGKQIWGLTDKGWKIIAVDMLQLPTDTPG